MAASITIALTWAWYAGLVFLLLTSAVLILFLGVLVGTSYTDTQTWALVCHPGRFLAVRESPDGKLRPFHLSASDCRLVICTCDVTRWPTRQPEGKLHIAVLEHRRRRVRIALVARPTRDACIDWLKNHFPAAQSLGKPVTAWGSANVGTRLVYPIPQDEQSTKLHALLTTDPRTLYSLAQSCPDCGYSLRGLLPIAKCPECGT